MDDAQRYIAKKWFELEVHKRNGQAFEDFFSLIMNKKYPNFRSIKPSGRIGDRKNDGFDPSSGTYYQVYAPENSNAKVSDAVKKLKTDFKGLYEQWNDASPISTFSFVLNDKYNGVHPDLALEIEELKKEYPNIHFKITVPSELQNMCFELDVDNIYSVLGHIPSPNTDLFNNVVMQDVVNYLLNAQVDNLNVSFPDNPDFDQKISFNSLSKHAETLLRSASFKEGDLKKYFKYEDPIIKEKLRSIFSSYYKKGRLQFPADQDSDKVFFYILDKACKVRTQSIQSAVLVLMAYYFSYCDIFEEPITPTQAELF